jgi:alpha-D-xyloside xylohydrolase
MGEETFHIQQLFDSPEDEAFYGLGAHQNAFMNYKGKNVDLWQYNIIDVIPFLVSSKNYGILWNNNSRTKFGDIREYQSISSLKLYGTNGTEGGLTAEYYKDTSFQILFTSRSESRIAHEFSDINDEYPKGFQQNVAAVRWSALDISSSVRNGSGKTISAKNRMDTHRWIYWIEISYSRTRRK